MDGSEEEERSWGEEPRGRRGGRVEEGEQGFASEDEGEDREELRGGGRRGGEEEGREGELGKEGCEMFGLMAREGRKLNDY